MPLHSPHSLHSCVPGLAATVGLLLLAACATPAKKVENHEDTLAAAGFIARPANTPKREQMLANLPPHRFVRRAHGDSFVYIYSDPDVCHCLYIGDDKAIGKYQEMRYDRQTLKDAGADEQNLSNQEAHADALKVEIDDQPEWDWGPWGPGPYW